MNKKILFLMVISTLILFSGCNAKYEKTKEKTAEGQITGTTGLSINFLNLPDKIFPKQTFNIPIKIENKGKADVEEAILTISGYDENHIKLSSNRITGISLKGADPFSKIGESTIRNFNVISSIPPEIDYKANFVVTTCYKYKTEASPTICINPKLFTQGVAMKGECKNIDAVMSSQGAPLAVTKVESWFASDASFWEFRIFVENKGKGRLRFEDSYLKDCYDVSLEENDIDKVKIQTYVGGKQIKCSNDGFQTTSDSFFLIEGKGEVRCRMDINSNQPAYTTPLTIILSYGYVDSISKQIPMIKRPQI